MQSVDSRLGAIEAVLVRIEKQISGNGQKGLIQRVEDLELWRSGIVAVLAFIVGVGGLWAALK